MVSGSSVSTARSANLPGAMVPRLCSWPRAHAASIVKARIASSTVTASPSSMVRRFLLRRLTMLCMVNHGLHANGWAPAVSDFEGSRAPLVHIFVVQRRQQYRWHCDGEEGTSTWTPLSALPPATERDSPPCGESLLPQLTLTDPRVLDAIEP